MRPVDKISYEVRVVVNCPSDADEVSKGITSILSAAFGQNANEMRRAENELRAVIDRLEERARHNERVRCYTAVRQIVDARPFEDVDREVVAAIVERIMENNLRGKGG